MIRPLRQSLLPFKCEMMDRDDTLTGFGGLPLLHEMMLALELPRFVRRTLKLKGKGWEEWRLLEALIVMTVAGGEHMGDIAMLKSDGAYHRLIGNEGMPGPKAVERFLKRFHDQALVDERPLFPRSWVPKETKALQSLGKIDRHIARKLIERSGLATVTIENDATVVTSHKDGALATYKGGVGYLPVIGTIAELGIVIADEFRDGNVAPAHDVLGFFKRCFSVIPKGMHHIRTRLDGAYYDHDLIDFLGREKISFTITGEKRAGILDWIERIPDQEWKPLTKITEQGSVPTGREWTEIDWVSANGSQEQMRDRTYRYLVTRKTADQWELFQEEAAGEVVRKERYELIVTNMKWEGDRLIRWHHERGGTIEHVNKQIKSDLAGGTLPCAEFGANAAWWRIQCIAQNLVQALQLHALPEELSTCRLKKLRLWLFCIAGRVIKTGRQIIIKLRHGHPSFEIYRDARRLIANMAGT